MQWKTIIVLIALSIKSISVEKAGWSIVGNPLAFFHPCKGNENISASFESGRPPGEENQYTVTIQESVPSHTQINIKFDSEVTVALTNSSSARISTINNIFNIRFFRDADYVPALLVKGPATGTVPYMTSLKINNVEYCDDPNIGFLDQYILGYQDTAAVSLAVPDDKCGRRKVDHTELIVNGLETAPGEWPWHVALYRLEVVNIKYVCGGTLLSKNFVLTAAHCTTIRGIPVLPEIISVVLGKYNLIGGDLGSQEREVHKIIVHEQFNVSNLNNDISLLKMKTEAVLTDYVQPACVWYTDAYKKLPPRGVYGTVVGWGFDQTDTLSSQLRRATMPKVSESKCLKSNPVFFGRMLNDNKFCAGLQNGTSACNGDSGGGFMIFVPDISGDTSPNATGTWQIRGIVSVGVRRADKLVCDPSQYVLFTDVAKFKGWLQRNMK